MLSVYTREGYHVLRTRYLEPAEALECRLYYESLGYVVKDVK